VVDFIGIFRSFKGLFGTVEIGPFLPPKWRRPIHRVPHIREAYVGSIERQLDPLFVWAGFAERNGFSPLCFGRMENTVRAQREFPT